MVYDCGFPPVLAYACLAVGLASAVLAGVAAYHTRPKRPQPAPSAANSVGWTPPASTRPNTAPRAKPRILVHDDKRDWAAERDEKE